jgi:ATP-binding cassette subfamily F protein uup
MPLLRLENVSLSFGQVPILDKVNLNIDPREKIFLVGRNGIGKSCLLNVIQGTLPADDGAIHREPGLKIAVLEQELPQDEQITVYDYVALGLNEVGVLLQRYHHLILDPKVESKAWMDELEDVQKHIELRQGWQFGQIIDDVLTRLELPADKPLSTLSGGWKRRAALAKALVSQPDLLLLDEPTNHLDLAAIEWLEEYLSTYNGALLCITHDRVFLRKLSQRIIELDRGILSSYIGNYDGYLVDKNHRLEVESRQAKLFDKVLAKEEAWIRQGVKARRTRNEGRVRQLEQLRRERSERRELQGKPQFTNTQQVSSGDLVIDAVKVNYAIADKKLVNNFSMRIFKGDKIALIGPNGVGKSTLLKLLLGVLQPQSGTIKLGTNLHIAYFDQLRAGINFDQNAVDNVANGRDSIIVNGKSKHIISYLSDFLFTPERMRLPVRRLSGGECNRLLLAKLFSVPNNLLVMDEPTNDLDIESLELLEEILSEYTGTLLLVSHDREFVDQVATSTLCFRGDGVIEENVGGFKDIPMLLNQKIEKPVTAPKPVAATKPKVASNFTSQMRKELQDLPQKLEKLEAEQQQLHVQLADPGFYQQDPEKVKKIVAQSGKVDAELAILFKRWEELEQLKNNQ